ncbi:MAG: hypothetical protein RRC07_01955 [Anaerolineae bacterium]|nr:hypothetical protein [Anaerolineae bacterium]
MAQKKYDRVKQSLLLVFVFASVLLIGLIWADGLVGDAERTPSYYRGVPADAESTPATLPTVTPLPPEAMPDEPLILPGLDDDGA